ncbi:uncharacterized protein K489DRAFT_318262 [Dissoconium aciculare CBS 342.82]|uniref:Heterokaryon incompatibility domain-containing protein n=1 Tax=Dissoconium aciculare CBS 342.82 TaxID=1314786 RepID=A0A6J3M6E8_9PEZI|nr:uncharacterized protein K489DRAFT_318262 [Dissoconium aciculare CBS 342.82]KAF1823473.1 hypothetical protein K489DRAFT_318262 [Dissoconium aciculare CBS 342.82]
MSLTRWRSPPTSPVLESPDFRYGALKSVKTSIRLAKIKPGCGHKGITIELIESFVTVPGQRPQIEYDALSYTWGASKRTKSIMCNGRRLAVTPTLIEALHHFRHPDHEVILWIDQLCICQERVLERNAQVNLMGDIFAGARKVSVWLGPHSGDSKAGLQLAKQLLSITRYTNVTHLDSVQLEANGLPRRGHRKWMALAAILRRPWFWRTWIV